MSFLAPFPVLLLDMNGTFMFSGDRFGPEQDYAATYGQLGGTRAADRVVGLIQGCYARLLACYNDPDQHTVFPRVADTLRALPEAAGLDEDEIARMADVFAFHECGRVPSAYAAALRHLTTRHRLGLVTDIWAEKARWLAELHRAAVLDAFETCVFSSDLGCVKPSPEVFEEALATLRVGPADCAMIGDSPRDMEGAQSVGIATIWVGTKPPPLAVDGVVPSLLALVE